MIAPTVTRSQLEPLLERVLSGSDAKDAFILVRAMPADLPDSLTVAGKRVDILSSSSPLEIRSRLVAERSVPLAVLTDCDNTQLGDDVIARSVKQRVNAVDRWATVAQLFGAQRVTRRLAECQALADVLIESKPIGGYQPITTKVVDLETALDAVASEALGIRAETLVDLLAWAETSAAGHAFRELDPKVIALLRDHLVERFGPGVRVIFAALALGNAAELTPLALAAGVVHHDEVDSQVGRIKLESQLQDPRLDAAAYLRLSEAAYVRVTNASPTEPVANWRVTADEFLTRFDASEHAWRSDVSPLGFKQRLIQAAEAIRELRQDPQDSALDERVDTLLKAARGHVEDRKTPHRVERLEMAQRIARHLDHDIAAPTTLGETIEWYISDQAWFDRARVVLSRGDEEPLVDVVCKELAQEADAKAAMIAEAVAVQLSYASHLIDSKVPGVEHVLERVVAPTAADVPVLVLVLDGMGWPTFLEVLEEVTREGWQPRTHSNLPAYPAAVATFPTVTEFSRTSLLCGRLRNGNKDSEKRAFTAQPDLLRVSDKGKPPLLFHKTDLRVDGLDVSSSGLLEAIRDPTNQVVGLVLNNVDERLKDVSFPPGAWTLDELTPLREVLAGARQSGRMVLVTADHGHVLERGSEHRQGGGGERYRRPDTGPAGAGEIEITGPRVLTDNNVVIVPWQEQLRYGASRNGYHGGITPAETIVPVVVLSTETVGEWEPLELQPPAWWYSPIESKSNGQPPVIASKPVKTRQKAQPETVSLFDDDAIEPVATQPKDRISAIMATERIEAGLRERRLEPAVVESVLRLLDGTGGTALGQERLAAHVGMPLARFGRMLAQLQRVINIDGFDILSVQSSDVSFARDILETQLELS